MDVASGKAENLCSDNRQSENCCSERINTVKHIWKESKKLQQIVVSAKKLCKQSEKAEKAEKIWRTSEKGIKNLQDVFCSKERSKRTKYILQENRKKQ
jgi:hypothetical protein